MPRISPESVAPGQHFSREILARITFCFGWADHQVAVHRLLASRLAAKDCLRGAIAAGMSAFIERNSEAPVPPAATGTSAADLKSRRSARTDSS